MRQEEGNTKPVQHKEPISQPDLEKIKYHFMLDKSAENLTCHVWFSLALHLGLRGCELQEKILKKDVEFGKDDTGEYVHLSPDFATKKLSRWAWLYEERCGRWSNTGSRLNSIHEDDVRPPPS